MHDSSSSSNRQGKAWRAPCALRSKNRRVPLQSRSNLPGNLNRTSHRIRPRAIEDLVGPEHHDDLLLADVCDVVRPARDGLDDGRLLAVGLDGLGLVGQDLVEAKARLSLHHQELLGLGGDDSVRPRVIFGWAVKNENCPESGVFSISKKHQFRRVMGQAKHIHHNVLGGRCS